MPVLGNARHARRLQRQVRMPAGIGLGRALRRMGIGIAGIVADDGLELRRQQAHQAEHDAAAISGLQVEDEVVMRCPDRFHPLQRGDKLAFAAAHIDGENLGKTRITFEQAIPRLQGIEVNVRRWISGTNIVDKSGRAHHIAHGAPLDDQDAPDS